jgi:archaellum component FlaC
MSEENAAIHRTLGQLLEAVKHLGDDVHNVRSDMLRSEHKSDESRAVMHRRVDTLVDRVAGVETSVAQTQADIKDMKPVTDDVKKWKLMGMGALGVVGIGGIALGVTLAGFFDQLVKFVRATG